MIPNFVGADVAAWRLAQTDEWKRARTVKTNPDAPQIPIRLRALYEGKIVYAPVPYLTKSFPYLRIDPKRMIEKWHFVRACSDVAGLRRTWRGDRIRGRGAARLLRRRLGCRQPPGRAHRQGRRLRRPRNSDLPRTRHRRRYDTDRDDSPFVATGRRQRVVIEAHDTPLDFIATEAELIRTAYHAASAAWRGRLGARASGPVRVDPFPHESARPHAGPPGGRLRMEIDDPHDLRWRSAAVRRL